MYLLTRVICRQGDRGGKRAQQHTSHCLYVTVQNCVCRLDEDAEIILFLCDASDSTRLKVGRREL